MTKKPSEPQGKMLEEITRAIADKVRKELWLSPHILESIAQITQSDNPQQRAYEQFFRDLYQIPTITRAIMQLSRTYLEDLLPEEVRGLITDHEAVSIIAPTVISVFKYNLRAGYYFTTPVDPEAAARDVEKILLMTPYRKHRQKEMIREHYGFTEEGEPKTIQQIAVEHHQSKQSISEMITRGLETLRQLPATQELAIKYSSLGHRAELERQAREEANKEIEELTKRIDDYLSGETDRKAGINPETMSLLNSGIKKIINDLPTRFYAVIETREIQTVRELVRLHPRSLMREKNIGKRTVALVDEALHKYGLCLGMNV